jgi:Na+/pantothenate symporter
MLTYFNQIFDGLCKLFADVDVDVKNGSNLLDRLIKDIVTESESFDVERFIPLLQKYIRRTNPYIRQLLVGWITVLDSVPDINMIDWVSAYAYSVSRIVSLEALLLSLHVSRLQCAAAMVTGTAVSTLVEQCQPTVSQWCAVYSITVRQ